MLNTVTSCLEDRQQKVLSAILSFEQEKILDFTMFEDYQRHFLTDIKTGQIFTGKFSTIVVNLTQIYRAAQENIDSGLRDWARLFQATTGEEIQCKGGGGYKYWEKEGAR